MTEKLKNGIYRIIIPFEDIYTTAFILTDKGCGAIIDSGDNADDAEKYIIPFVNELNIKVKYIITTHSHSDHAGGKERLNKEYPDAKSNGFSEGEILFSRFKLISFKGHSEDGLGVYDTETKTLLSGDALQLYGVGRYRTFVSNMSEYLNDIEKVRHMDIKTIIASHNYDYSGHIARGKDEINAYLNECLNAIK